jgi:prepilin-type N-terminal cleavage/methylation domain-containing protein
MSRKERGFTLIELLVVISIVALLSSVVLSALGASRVRAGNAKAKADMYQFIKAVSVAQGESGKTLMTMSGNGGSTISNCSRCACSGDLRNIANACYTNWVAVLTGVQNNTNGTVSGLTRLTRDPWGSPYLVDENQGEGTLPAACSNIDTISSAGPDGTSGTSDDVASPIAIPNSSVCP